MFRTLVFAEVASVVLGLALFGALSVALGENPFALFGRQAIVLARTLGEPRLFPYLLLFVLYIAQLPALLAAIRRGLLERLLVACLTYALMHLGFHTLQFAFPLSGYEELMLMFPTVAGFFWILLSVAGTLLAERLAGATHV